MCSPQNVFSSGSKFYTATGFGNLALSATLQDVPEPDWELSDALQWRHNGRDSVSNNQPHDCLLNHLFRRRSKKTSKLRVTAVCAGNSPGTGEFPHKGQWRGKCFHLMTSSWHKKSRRRRGKGSSFLIKVERGSHHGDNHACQCDLMVIKVPGNYLQVYLGVTKCWLAVPADQKQAKWIRPTILLATCTDTRIFDMRGNSYYFPRSLTFGG